MIKKIFKENKFKLLIIVLFIIIGVFLCFPKSNNNNINNKNKKNYKSKTYKTSYVEGKNGWVYFLSFSKVISLKDEVKMNYLFDGCNLKYEKLDYVYGYLDEKKGYVSKVPIVPPALDSSNFSVNNTKTESEEVELINNILSSFEENKSVTYDDFKDIELVNFNKDDIISLFEKLNSKKAYNEAGPYANKPVCFYKKNTNDSGTFQIGALIDYGYIGYVRIDYIDKNGILLSDKYTNNSLTSNETELYNNLLIIQEYIVKHNTFNIREEFDELSNAEEYKTLFDLLDQIEK